MKSNITYYPKTTLTAWKSCLEYLKAPHLLIAGATGSGKSVLINSIIFSALSKSPAYNQFFFIDLKRVELSEYKQVPHCLGYADTPESAKSIIDYAVQLLEYRFRDMQNRAAVTGKPCKIFSPDGSKQVYLIIDEYADLVTTCGKSIQNNLSRIAILGRAAGIHLLIATQRPTRDIIDGRIKANIDSRIALRTSTAQESRNIIDVSGAEKLPEYGQGYFLKHGYLNKITVPLTSETDIMQRIAFWKQF